MGECARARRDGGTRCRAHTQQTATQAAGQASPQARPPAAARVAPAAGGASSPGHSQKGGRRLLPPQRRPSRRPSARQPARGWAGRGRAFGPTRRAPSPLPSQACVRGGERRRTPALLPLAAHCVQDARALSQPLPAHIVGRTPYRTDGNGCAAAHRCVIGAARGGENTRLHPALRLANRALAGRPPAPQRLRNRIAVHPLDPPGKGRCVRGRLGRGG